MVKKKGTNIGDEEKDCLLGNTAKKVLGGTAIEMRHGAAMNYRKQSDRTMDDDPRTLRPAFVCFCVFCSA